MNIVVHPELQAYIDPLTAEEHEALERSLLTEGCRDALVLWGDVLVDGHNRHALCLKHGLPFRTTQHPHFRSIDDVHLWMIDQHLGRRSVSDFQRGLLALRKRELVAAQRARAFDAAPPPDAGAANRGPDGSDATEPTATPSADATRWPQASLDSREALARAARLSAAQVQMIEKIQKQAAPEVVAAVRAGTLSINAAAAVATLPPEAQVAAAQAGADELRQAARRVREARRKPRSDTAPAPMTATDTAPETPASPVSAVGAAAERVDNGGHGVDSDNAGDTRATSDTVAGLRRRVAELLAENATLRAQLADLQSTGPAR